MNVKMLGEQDGRRDPRRVACALIAIKERVHCKQRLAGVLAPDSRLQLVRLMLARVLAAAAGAKTVRQIMVVSPERDDISREIPVLADSGEGLNDALSQAHRVLGQFGAREVVILPADLPMITAADIDTIVHAKRDGGCSMVSDLAGVGTNALCLTSPRPFCFQFGPDSLRRHMEEAQRAGMSARVLALPGVQFDVDTPADLQHCEEQQWRIGRQT